MILSNKMSQKMNSIRTLCPQCLGVSSSQCPQHQIYEWSLKPLICKAITRWRHTLGVNKNFQDEKEKYLAAGVECDDTEVSATIRATLKNWLDRALQDPEVKEPVERLKKIHGNNVKFKCIYKIGFDGSTQAHHNVSKNLLSSKWSISNHFQFWILCCFHEFSLIFQLVL